MTNNKKYVLDASALISLLQEEKGSDILKPILSNVIMSAINVSECLTVLARHGIPVNETNSLINDIVKSIIPFDLQQAKLAAELSPLTKHKGLSLGDRACIALGQSSKSTIFTADKIWKELNLSKCEIVLIR